MAQLIDINLIFWAQLGSSNIKLELLGSAQLQQIKLRATLARLSLTKNCWPNYPCQRLHQKIKYFNLPFCLLLNLFYCNIHTPPPSLNQTSFKYAYDIFRKFQEA
jgi:hypothetical protein